MRILLVEDDETLAQVVAQALTGQHYLVDIANDGQAGWELAEALEYDLILLDLMLPKLDGISFCRQRRQKGDPVGFRYADRTPILLLTAQDVSTNKVAGLDAGADDYVVKPFDLQELLARIRALLRRGMPLAPVIEWGGLSLDPSNCEVTYNGQLLHLTPKEYALLELFLRNNHRIFSQSALLDHLWSFDEPPSENTVRAHIKSLRSKLKKAGAAADLIETVYGLGYRLKSIESGGRGGVLAQPDAKTDNLHSKPALSGGAGEQGCRGGISTQPDAKTDNLHSQPALSGRAQQQDCRGGVLTQPDTKTDNLHSKPALSESPGEQGCRGGLSTQPDTKTGNLHSKPALSGRAQEQILPEIAAIWERFKHKYSDRVTVLEQAVTAVRENALSEELRQQAYRQAHTLKGSLGSFGFAEASRLSGEIEQILQPGGRLSRLDLEPLSGLVVALRQQLEQQPTIESPVPQSAPLKQQSRLLIVDDDAALAEQLISEATARGMQAVVAGDLSQAREALARNRPDVVLLDLCFADSAENGFALLAELATKDPPVPVLVFTAQESFADRVKVARLGGRGFLQKPVSPDRVMDAIAQLQHSSTPEAKLLIVDDDPQLLDFLRTLLEPWGFKLTLLDNPQLFWDTLSQFAPDLLILDVEMPEFSGIDLCQVVRNDSRWSDLPVLFLSARTDPDTVHRVFTAGADDYVSKPIIGPELVARVLNRLERTQILRKLQNGGVMG